MYKPSPFFSTLYKAKNDLIVSVASIFIKYSNDIMDGGKIIEEGTPHHIFFESKNTRVTNFLNIMR